MWYANVVFMVMKKVLMMALGTLTVLLLISAVWSGYNYVFDNDELAHIHTIYLIVKGYQPYTSFFSIYTPVLHWLLVPLFRINGFFLSTIADARFVMILLFLLRIGAASLLIKELFGKRIAFLFIPIFLMDPFTVFTAMQIRPDNLMMTFYTLGLLVATLGVKRKDKRLVFVAGLFLGTAVVTMIKIIPSLCIFGVLILIFHRAKGIRDAVIPLFVGFGTIVGFFLFSFFASGTLVVMIRQVIFDGKLLNDSLLYPVTPGNFYWPVNVYLYGFSDRSLVWIYEWGILIVGFSGAFRIFFHSVSEPLSLRSLLKLLIPITLGIHWLLLFSFRSVFLQYYLPVSWLLAVGVAVVVDDLISTTYQNNIFRFTVLASLVTAFLLVGKASIDLNLMRASIDGHEEESRLEAILAKIPENEPVFPGFLFRPLVYPIPYGYYYGDMPSNVTTRFPPVGEILDKKNVRFLVATETYLSYLPKDAQQYIKEHFLKDLKLEDLWVRKRE